MNNHPELTFSQSLISYFSDITQSTVSRFIAHRGFQHLEKFGDKRKKYDLETTRNIFYELLTCQLKPIHKIQVFFNFKGGTGKTSICHQVSTMFAILGFRVLAVDCDPQAHLSYSLGFNEQEEHITLYDVVVNKIPISSIIFKDLYPGLDVIPSNLSLTRLEASLNQMPNRERVLSKILDQIAENYDFVFIDTNPTISTLNRNATLAADMLNIVCETQPYSLKGMEMLVNEIQDFSDVMEKKVKYQIIPNKYEAKTATSQEALGTLRYDYKENVIQSVVRKCEDINISAKMRKPVFGFCSKKSIALEDIKDLVKELMIKSTVGMSNINQKEYVDADR